MDEKTILPTDERETNPFNLLGIESWVLKSLDFQALKRFLGDFRRIVGKYHHPDLFHDTEERAKHERYFALASGAIDRLLGDEFYFRKSLDDLRSGDILQRVKRAHSAEESRLRSLLIDADETSKKLQARLSSAEGTIEQSKRVFGNIRRIERTLIEEGKSAPLAKGSQYKIQFVFAHGLVDSISSALPGFADKIKEPLEFEETMRSLAAQIVCDKYTLKRENAQDKRFPIFEGTLKGGEYNIVYYPGKSNQAVVPARIFGGLTYSAIKGYFDMHNFNLEERNTLEVNPLFREFGNPGPIDRVSQFVSNFVFPYSFAIAETWGKQRGKVREKQELFMITDIEKLE